MLFVNELGPPDPSVETNTNLSVFDNGAAISLVISGSLLVTNSTNAALP